MVLSMQILGMCDEDCRKCVQNIIRKAGSDMEMRFILEHVEATVLSARKSFDNGDRDRCSFVLEDLGEWLVQRFEEGVLEGPNIDIKPEEPEQKSS